MLWGFCGFRPLNVSQEVNIAYQMDRPWTAAFPNEGMGMRLGSGSAHSGAATDGSASGTDPFENVLSKEDTKGLHFSGRNDDAADFLFVLDDKLESKLSHIDYSISAGTMTRSDAVEHDLEAQWHNTNRFYYTFLLGRISRDTSEGKLLLAQAYRRSSFLAHTDPFLVGFCTLCCWHDP